MLSEEEKKAVEYLEYMKNRLDFNKIGYVYAKEYIDTVLNLITKLQKENEEKDKQIDLMAEYMFNKNKAQLIIEYGIENKEQFIEKFEKLAKEKGE